MTLTRHVPLRRRKPLRRRVKLHTIYRSPITDATRAVMAARCTRADEQKHCEIGGEPVEHWEYSHRQRSEGGLHGPSNGLVSCRRHHRQITSAHGPALTAALANGWLVSAFHPNPGAVPVLIGKLGWRLLAGDGSYREVTAP